MEAEPAATRSEESPSVATAPAAFDFQPVGRVHVGSGSGSYEQLEASLDSELDLVLFAGAAASNLNLLSCARGRSLSFDGRGLVGGDAGRGRRGRSGAGRRGGGRGWQSSSLPGPLAGPGQRQEPAAAASGKRAATRSDVDSQMEAAFQREMAAGSPWPPPRRPRFHRDRDSTASELGQPLGPGTVPASGPARADAAVAAAAAAASAPPASGNGASSPGPDPSPGASWIAGIPIAPPGAPQYVYAWPHAQQGAAGVASLSAPRLPVTLPPAQAGVAAAELYRLAAAAAAAVALQFQAGARALEARGSMMQPPAVPASWSGIHVQPLAGLAGDQPIATAGAAVHQGLTPGSTFTPPPTRTAAAAAGPGQPASRWPRQYAAAAGSGPGSSSQVAPAADMAQWWLPPLAALVRVSPAERELAVMHLLQQLQAGAAAAAPVPQVARPEASDRDGHPGRRHGEQDLDRRGDGPPPLPVAAAGHSGWHASGPPLPAAAHPDPAMTRDPDDAVPAGLTSFSSGTGTIGLGGGRPPTLQLPAAVSGPGADSGTRTFPFGGLSSSWTPVPPAGSGSLGAGGLLQDADALLALAAPIAMIADSEPAGAAHMHQPALRMPVSWPRPPGPPPPPPPLQHDDDSSARDPRPIAASPSPSQQPPQPRELQRRRAPAAGHGTGTSTGVSEDSEESDPSTPAAAASATAEESEAARLQRQRRAAYFAAVATAALDSSSSAESD